MSQPEWELVGHVGDVNPIDHDGGYVYRDKTGVYPPECEWIEANGPGTKWRVYRFVLEPCTYVNGVLSDNPHHPESQAWFADSLKRIGSEGFIISLLCSDNLMERAVAWVEVGQYFGFENMDEYPIVFTGRAELKARYANL